MELDQPQPLYSNEAINLPGLQAFLDERAPYIGKVWSVSQFGGGFSNLTYCLHTVGRDYVLRRPPQGAAIQSAHDMSREFRVLSLLQGHYQPIPTPILYCENTEVIGAEFYLMERLQGVILRPSNTPQMNLAPELLRQIAASVVDNLVALHALDIEATGLAQLGRPEGYVERQVEGWIKRYRLAETDSISAMNSVAKWIAEHLPSSQQPTLLHNDYKYDNVLLDPDDLTQVRGVLDWEMATVGDPLMDVGAMLAYWMETGDGETARHYNITWLPGQPTRQEVVDHYARQSGRYLSGIMFYYVFGLFKNAVIAQQIYARWKQGHSQDARFGRLLPLVVELAERAEKALHTGRL